MKPRDKKYFLQKISALRKSMQILEEELGEDEAPVLPKRKRKKNPLMQSFENRYELGISSKPVLTKRLPIN